MNTFFTLLIGMLFGLVLAKILSRLAWFKRRDRAVVKNKQEWIDILSFLFIFTSTLLILTGVGLSCRYGPREGLKLVVGAIFSLLIMFLIGGKKLRRYF